MSEASRPQRGTYMISAVATLYKIHPQTLRLYEREGLLKPSRSEGNTRLYSDEDLRRLELILSLTRELGVNLAGVEVILNMRANLASLQSEVRDLVTFVRNELLQDQRQLRAEFERALVRVESSAMVQTSRDSATRRRSSEP